MRTFFCFICFLLVRLASFCSWRRTCLPDAAGGYRCSLLIPFCDQAGMGEVLGSVGKVLVQRNEDKRKEPNEEYKGS